MTQNAGFYGRKTVVNKHSKKTNVTQRRRQKVITVTKSTLLYNPLYTTNVKTSSTKGGHLIRSKIKLTF